MRRKSGTQKARLSRWSRTTCSGAVAGQIRPKVPKLAGITRSNPMSSSKGALHRVVSMLPNDHADFRVARKASAAIGPGARRCSSAAGRLPPCAIAITSAWAPVSSSTAGKSPLAQDRPHHVSMLRISLAPSGGQPAASARAGIVCCCYHPPAPDAVCRDSCGRGRPWKAERLNQRERVSPACQATLRLAAKRLRSMATGSSGFAFRPRILVFSRNLTTAGTDCRKDAPRHGGERWLPSPLHRRISRCLPS